MIFRDGRPNNKPAIPAARAPQGKSGPEWPTELGAQNRRGITADRHESRMADGNLTAVAGENIEPVDADNGDAHCRQDGQHPVAEKEGTGEKKDDRSNN